MNEVIRTILNRRSIRSYLPDPIPQETMNTVIQAGLAAPSAMNQQSWHFVVLQGGRCSTLPELLYRKAGTGSILWRSGNDSGLC